MDYRYEGLLHVEEMRTLPYELSKIITRKALRSIELKENSITFNFLDVNFTHQILFKDIQFIKKKTGNKIIIGTSQGDVLVFKPKLRDFVKLYQLLEHSQRKSINKEEKDSEQKKKENEEKERLDLEKIIDVIKKLSNVYEKISFEEIEKRSEMKKAAIISLVENMIIDGEINATISGKNLLFRKISSQQVQPIETSIGPFLDNSQAEKQALEKLKKIISVSDRIEIEMMQKSLRMDDELFLDKIYDWAAEFNFRIDKDVLVINQETVSDFLNALDKQFETWNHLEADHNGKI